MIGHPSPSRLHGYLCRACVSDDDDDDEKFDHRACYLHRAVHAQVSDKAAGRFFHFILLSFCLTCRSSSDALSLTTSNMFSGAVFSKL